MTEQPHPQQPQPYAAGPKRLVRNRDDKVLAGVCSGIADYLGLDRNLVRVLTVLGTVLGAGALVIAYVAAWILVPAEAGPAR